MGQVLEVGVGTGRQLPTTLPEPKSPRWTPNAAALRLAGHRSPGARLVVAEAEALPFSDRSFDWVVFALVLCSVRDPDATQREVRPVLRAGGRLRILEHVRSPHPVLARARTLANPMWGVVAGGCHLDRPTQEYIVSAGFSLVTRRAHLGGHVVLLEAAAIAPLQAGPEGLPPGLILSDSFGLESRPNRIFQAFLHRAIAPTAPAASRHLRRPIAQTALVDRTRCGGSGTQNRALRWSPDARRHRSSLLPLPQSIAAAST